ncbi:MAG: alpha/beta fold hydrolase [Alphaproteobacteria bacterium]
MAMIEPETSERIIANGIGVRYRFDGPDDAPVVLFSHSLASGLEMWDAQAAALAEFLARH